MERLIVRVFAGRNIRWRTWNWEEGVGGESQGDKWRERKGVERGFCRIVGTDQKQKIFQTFFVAGKGAL